MAHGDRRENDVRCHLPRAIDRSLDFVGEQNGEPVSAQSGGKLAKSIEIRIDEEDSSCQGGP